MSASLRRLSARPLAAAGAFLLLASCAEPEPNLAPVAQRSLVGITQSQLLTCAGVPERTHVTATGIEYYTYANETFASAPGTSLGVGIGTTSNNIGVGVGFPIAGTGSITNQSCEVTFALSDGIVRDVNYTATGGIGSQRNRLCNDIVRACVQSLGPSGQ